MARTTVGRGAAGTLLSRDLYPGSATELGLSLQREAALRSVLCQSGGNVAGICGGPKASGSATGVHGDPAHLGTSLALPSASASGGGAGWNQCGGTMGPAEVSGPVPLSGGGDEPGV